MTPEEHLIAAIEQMGDDKSLSQPWKNYAISDARRAVASLKMSNGSIHYSGTKDGTRGELEGNAGDLNVGGECICRPGLRNADCEAVNHIA